MNADFSLQSTAEELKILVDAINVLADEASFKVTKEGLRFTQMDPSRVAMIDLLKPPERFEEYNVKEEGKICLNIGELKKILGRAGKEDKIKLRTDPKTAKLIIEIDFQTQSKQRHASFTMPTLEPYEEECPTPKVDFTTRWKGDSQVLLDAFEDTALVADHVKIIALEDGLQLKAGGDFAQADIKLRKGQDATLDFFNKATGEEKVVATFSLSYLTEMVKAGCKLSATATLEYSKDMPNKITFGDISFYLAPRIEVE